MLHSAGWRNPIQNATSKVVSVLPGCLASEPTNGNFKGQFDPPALWRVVGQGVVVKPSLKPHRGESQQNLLGPTASVSAWFLRPLSELLPRLGKRNRG